MHTIRGRADPQSSPLVIVAVVYVLCYIIPFWFLRIYRWRHQQSTPEPASRNNTGDMRVSGGSKAEDEKAGHRRHHKRHRHPSEHERDERAVDVPTP